MSVINHTDARKMMRWFYGMKEVADCFEPLSKEQKRALREIPFSRELLAKHANDCILYVDLGWSLNKMLQLKKRLWWLELYGYSLRNGFVAHEFAQESEDLCWRLIRIGCKYAYSPSDIPEMKVEYSADRRLSARQVVCLSLLSFHVNKRYPLNSGIPVITSSIADKHWRIMIRLLSGSHSSTLRMWKDDRHPFGWI
jgi:hypothetical protein